MKNPKFSGFIFVLFVAGFGHLISNIWLAIVCGLLLGLLSEYSHYIIWLARRYPKIICSIFLLFVLLFYFKDLLAELTDSKSEK